MSNDGRWTAALVDMRLDATTSEIIHLGRTADADPREVLLMVAKRLEHHAAEIRKLLADATEEVSP